LTPLLNHVLYLFISAAFATAALPNEPDPPADPAAGTVRAQSRTGRLLGLLRKLIDYGTELARSLQQGTAVTAVRRRATISESVMTRTLMRHGGRWPPVRSMTAY